MNRDREWDFMDNKIEDDKTLLATFAIVVKELAIKCPNDQELGRKVRELNLQKELNYVIDPTIWTTTTTWEMMDWTS